MLGYEGQGEELSVPLTEGGDGSSTGRLEAMLAGVFGGNVSADAVRELAQSMVRVELSRRDKIVPPDQGGAWFAVVTEGVVVYRRRLATGDSHIVDIVDAGNVVGDLDGRFADGRGTLDMQCASHQAVIYQGHSRDFDAWLQRHPAAAWPAIAHAFMMRRKAIDDFGLQISRSIPGRVAALILRLTSAFGQSDGDVIVVQHGLTQGELATSIGATRESVNKALNEFAAQGWIGLRTGALIIKDTHALSEQTR